jgi:spore coat protein SA
VAPELLPVPPTRGGAIERWIRDAAGRLVGRGHEVHVIARDHGDPSAGSGSARARSRGDGATTTIIDGVHYHHIHVPPYLDRGLPAAVLRGLWYYRTAGRIIRRIAPDVIHHHSRPAGLWLSGGAAPKVISLHSMEYGWGFGYRGWDRRLFRRGLVAAARVLCVSHFIRRHTLERYPELQATAITVYNGVDGNLFKPGTGSREPRTESQDLKPSGPQALILYVGRVEERKGVHVLVDAFEKWISKQAPEARLLIVGPHSYWDAQPSTYYTNLLKRCKANPRIELRGPTYVDQELAQVYQSATVSVIPSTFPEALGLTSIEAQAAGAPVVVSDAGGLPETVSAGKSGIVYANGHAEQLATAVLGLLADESRRRTMAAAARDWAMTTFSWDVIAAQLEGVYAEALAGAAR